MLHPGCRNLHASDPLVSKLHANEARRMEASIHTDTNPQQILRVELRRTLNIWDSHLNSLDAPNVAQAAIRDWARYLAYGAGLMIRGLKTNIFKFKIR